MCTIHINPWTETCQSLGFAHVSLYHEVLIWFLGYHTRLYCNLQWGNWCMLCAIWAPRRYISLYCLLDGNCAWPAVLGCGQRKLRIFLIDQSITSGLCGFCLYGQDHGKTSWIKAGCSKSSLKWSLQALYKDYQPCLFCYSVITLCILFMVVHVIWNKWCNADESANVPGWDRSFS